MVNFAEHVKIPRAESCNDVMHNWGSFWGSRIIQESSILMSIVIKRFDCTTCNMWWFATQIMKSCTFKNYKHHMCNRSLVMILKYKFPMCVYIHQIWTEINSNEWVMKMVLYKDMNTIITFSANASIHMSKYAWSVVH